MMCDCNDYCSWCTDMRTKPVVTLSNAGRRIIQLETALRDAANLIVDSCCTCMIEANPDSKTHDADCQGVVLSTPYFEILKGTK